MLQVARCRVWQITLLRRYPSSYQDANVRGARIDRRRHAADGARMHFDYHGKTSLAKATTIMFLVKQNTECSLL
jgi:hypothetical protein